MLEISFVANQKLSKLLPHPGLELHEGWWDGGGMKRSFYHEGGGAPLSPPLPIAAKVDMNFSLFLHCNTIIFFLFRGSRKYSAPDAHDAFPQDAKTQARTDFVQKAPAELTNFLTLGMRKSWVLPRS